MGPSAHRHDVRCLAYLEFWRLPVRRTTHYRATHAQVVYARDHSSGDDHTHASHICRRRVRCFTDQQDSFSYCSDIRRYVCISSIRIILEYCLRIVDGNGCSLHRGLSESCVRKSFGRVHRAVRRRTTFRFFAKRCPVNPVRPPMLATWLLQRLGPSPHNDALLGDLIEQYQHVPSSGWYWKQCLKAIAVGLLNECLAHKWLTLRALITGW